MGGLCATIEKQVEMGSEAAEPSMPKSIRLMLCAAITEAAIGDHHVRTQKTSRTLDLQAVRHPARALADDGTLRNYSACGNTR